MTDLRPGSARMLLTTAINALLVDVRAEDDYRKEHLAGAVSMPLRRLRVHAAELPSDTTLITYCA